MAQHYSRQRPAVELQVCGCVQLDKMESALGKEVTQLQDWQQRRQQLEEKVHSARSQLRDMKNTLEKSLLPQRGLPPLWLVVQSE